MKLTARSQIWVQLGDGALALVVVAIGVAVFRKATQWEPSARHLDVFSYALVVGGALRDYRCIVTGVAQRHQRTEARTSGRRSKSN